MSLKYHIKQVSIVLIIVLLSLVVIDILGNDPSQEDEKVLVLEDGEQAEERAITDKDFPSTEEGKLVGYVKQQASSNEKVILFKSVKIPGLSLIYNPPREQLIGGSPKMVAGNIRLLDGNLHQITYSFKKNNKQQIIYDGRLVAQSDFKIYGRNYFTALITGPPQGIMSDLWSNVSFSSSSGSFELE
jgi:hypothetical protein